MSNQLASITKEEKEVAACLEGYFNKKKADLDSNLNNLYRKTNFDFEIQRYTELKTLLENKKILVKDLKVKLDRTLENQENKKTAYEIHKAQKKILLQVLKDKMEELQKVVKVNLRALEKHIKEYTIELKGDNIRAEFLSKKLNSGTNNFRLTQQILSRKFKSINDLEIPEDSPLSLQENKLDEHNSVTTPSKTSRNIIITPKNKEYKESNGELHNYLYSCFNEKNSKYKIYTLTCSVKEIELFDTAKCLLEGVDIYHKNEGHNPIIKKRFDPLVSLKQPPEACGYRKRFLSYNPTINKLEFKYPKRLHIVEQLVSIESILRIVITNETKRIIKMQKVYNGDIKSTDSLDGFSSMSSIDKIERFERNETFRDQCSQVQFYPFSILTKEKPIELITESYTIFKYTIKAINKMIEDPNLLQKLCQKLIKNTQ